MNSFDWIEQTLNPQACDSERFFYDEMESQSNYCLPVIYQPFDPGNRGHWRDRGSLFDFLHALRASATGEQGQTLLDFGPGDGWPSLIVAPYAGQVIGVDGSQKRVDVCTANAARLGIGNARFVHVPPGERLPFPEGAFDGVMAASSIEQTPDPRATLKELCRVLRPGGRLRVSYESLGIYRDVQEHVVELHRAGPETCWLVFYDRQIEQERARMARLKLAMPANKVHELLMAGHPRADRLPEDWSVWDINRLKSVRGAILEARTCALSHPSGETLLRWLLEAGFSDAQPTHSGDWFAGQLFDRLPAGERPTDIQGIDALLSPLVQIVVQMPAPVRPHSGWDPMITAIK